MPAIADEFNLMPTEPSYPRRDDIEVPLLRVLVELAGSVRFSVRGRQIEDMLGHYLKLTNEQTEFASPNYHSEGHRKWRNEIQFVRDKLVKKGQIDPSRHDYWTITVAGYERLRLPPPPNAPSGQIAQRQPRRSRTSSRSKRQAIIDSL